MAVLLLLACVVQIVDLGPGALVLLLQGLMVIIKLIYNFKDFLVLIIQFPCNLAIDHCSSNHQHLSCKRSLFAFSLPTVTMWEG